MVLGVPAFEGYGLQPEGYGLQPVHQVLPFQQRALAPEGIESQFELSQSLSQQVPRSLLKWSWVSPPLKGTGFSPYIKFCLFSSGL